MKTATCAWTIKVSCSIADIFGAPSPRRIANMSVPKTRRKVFREAWQVLPVEQRLRCRRHATTACAACTALARCLQQSGHITTIAWSPMKALWILAAALGVGGFVQARPGIIEETSTITLPDPTYYLFGWHV